MGGRDGLIGYKANLSPAKLKLADIGLELSLAKVGDRFRIPKNTTEIKIERDYHRLGVFV